MGIPIEVAKDYGKVQENYKGSMGMEKGYINARRWLITPSATSTWAWGKWKRSSRAFERYRLLPGRLPQTLYEYNLAVAQLDKSSGAFRRTCRRKANRRKTSRRGGPSSPSAPRPRARPNRLAAVIAPNLSGQAPGPALFYERPSQ